MRIRNQLALMATAVLVPVVIAAGLAIGKIKEGEREAALRALGESARATALVVDREVQGSLSAMKVLGNSRNLELADLPAFHAEASALNRLPDVWTLLFDAEGRQVVNTRVPFGAPLPPAPSKVRTAKVFASREPLVTDLFPGQMTQRLLTTIYAPAEARGGNAFVVAQAFTVEFWARKLSGQDLPPGWIVGMLDRNGRVMARSVNGEDYIGKMARPELVAAAARSDDGLLEVPTFEGVDTYTAFTHSALTGWTVMVAAPATAVESAANQAVLFALSGMVLAAAAAIMVAVAFGRNFIRAIEGSREAAVALGRGEMPRADTSGVDEVNELNRALADAGQLLDAERQSRRQAEAERELLLAKETRAREAAQAQNDAKDQFLAMLGHELRNPLAAISGAVTLLRVQGEEGDRARHNLDIIQRQSGHLSHIVSDLLDVSRLMAGKIMLERQPMDLAESARRCVDALRMTGRADGLRISLAAEPAWIDGDPVRIEQILSNLLTNALKFSEPGGSVEVAVHCVQGQAHVTVTDHGAGIAPELLGRIFEPFVQGPPPANRMQSGMGIGLALVRQLVVLHGGEVSVTSAGPGCGSTFALTIPAIEPPGHQVDTSSGALESASVQAAQDSVQALARDSHAVPCIVYVEDNDDARATMGELLRALGYDVVEVDRGRAVLEAVAAARPGAVLMDIGLPDMDGYEVARGLRADPRTRDVPLVALTGYGQDRDKDAAALAGFNAHLIKPVDVQQMIRTLQAVLRPGAGSP